MSRRSKLLNSLLWRYATKKFDSAKKLSDTELNELLEVLRLAPSSFGLQPYKFIVVTNQDLRNKLRENAWNQAQVTDASHLIVLATRTDVNKEYVTNYVKHIANTRKLPVNALKSYEDNVINLVNSMTKDQVLEWCKKQTYITLGALIVAAAEKQIDMCPMEGFNVQKFDELLKLKEKNLTSTIICPVGFRADDDYAKLAKVRFNKEDIVVLN